MTTKYELEIKTTELKLLDEVLELSKAKSQEK
jgi:hypothetical protein